MSRLLPCMTLFGERFMRCHLGVYDGADDGGFPVRVEKSLAELCGECVKGVVFGKKLFLIILDPVINFDILERHEDVADFIFVGDFAFVKV